MTEADNSQPASQVRARQVATVIIVVGSAVGMLLAGRLSWLLVLSAFLTKNSVARIIRRSIRILVYVPPGTECNVATLAVHPRRVMVAAFASMVCCAPVLILLGLRMPLWVVACGTFCCTTGITQERSAREPQRGSRTTTN
jgi:hypothetical protein